MRDPNIIAFSHFKSVYTESIKTMFLAHYSTASVVVKMKEKTQNASYEHAYEGYRNIGKPGKMQRA